MITETRPDLLSSLIAGKPLDGVAFKALTEHTDARGSFTEIFRDSWGTCLTPAQWSLVRSEPNVFRGMHLHRRHDEYFSLIEGHCLIGLRDIRPDSPTYNQSALYELTGTDPKVLVFPRGLLHGWYFFIPSIHVQAVSEDYAHYSHDDNWGCHWSDPELELPWGISDPVLSDRASQFPPLRQLLKNLATPGFSA
ncbi:dTDP-4-dehydrorhamnose 3,5-epimerase family protein [Spirosoma taeanense]|uniref:dTDP-4-dehydrorhamnose 3,5-epimerase n=1 Tax=Spirosoma taeanense TaxID=2735870 RepID=A0A6M5Y5S0_9BACT|nr:dTDP-4-dehydrorhamnose 3,5-epimerase family protein [Spirosoma taeanense]QJW88756.1 dTDP-4-dehydrorhamnose 3,5-epimerase family protein [Spirosoma taeanense]